MAHHFNVVTVRVEKESSKIVLVIMRAGSRRTVVSGTSG
jgi:hypothetical protein